MDNDQLWQAVLGEIEVNVSRANFTTWFKNTFIGSYEGNTIVICVPNIFTKAWLEKKYDQEILLALRNITKEKEINLIYKIETRKSGPVLAGRETTRETNQEGAPVRRAETPVISFKNSNVNKFGLNNKYVFNNFIVGKNNELAHAACQAVAANPGQTYNPLVLHGGVGLGKTHLLQAVGNELAKVTDRILYVTSEKFCNDYINEVQSGRAKFLKEKYRNVDLLLIDDIQFLGGKDGTQEEFFHTFNELHQNNKQIVATCDRPLKAIPALEKRLLSRLEWGMVANITLPDYETRIAILQNKCQEKNYLLNDKILSYIATNAETNVRELEGVLTKLITYFEFNNLAPSLDETKRILIDNFSSFQESSLSSKSIIDAVSKFYSVTNKDLVSKSRKKELVKPRQVVMYLLRSEIEMSFPNIGQELGGRDHSTAMHACKKILQEIKNKERMAQEINSIKQLIKNYGG
jgi:chromosomal replication initiator protein